MGKMPSATAMTRRGVFWRKCSRTERYIGLGYRIGQRRKPKDGIFPERKIQDTIDLTRQYNNLLQRETDDKTQCYLGDGNVDAMSRKEAGLNYYLQDDMGSPIRLTGAGGSLTDTYGYDEFGNVLYDAQTSIQPFGYTGYQHDRIAGTYYAQAREYLPETGRFAGEDLLGGFMEEPVTINRYGYCWGNPLRFVDLDGMAPTEKECKGGYYEETMYGDVKGPSLNLYMGGKLNEKTNKRDMGVNLGSTQGGIGKIGYYDNKGIIRGKYQLECVHGRADAGVSEQYMGIRAQGSCVTISGKVRVLEVCGIRIYVGGKLNILSLGARYGYDSEKNEVGGVSLGVGVGLSISWEKIEKVECDNE